MRKTDKIAGEPIVTSLDILEMIINHTVEVYNMDVEDIPEIHRNGYRAGWLGYRVLGTLFAGGYIEAGGEQEQQTIDGIVKSLEEEDAK